MNKTKTEIGIASVMAISLLASCASPQGTSNGEESPCTKYAGLVNQYEKLIDYNGDFVPTFIGILGTHDDMREMGEPLPKRDYWTLPDTVEYVANSSFGQQCMSSSLRLAILDYVDERG